jgi:hypothetical protein
MALDRDQTTTDFLKSKESPALDSKMDPASNPDLEAVGEKSRFGFGGSDKNVGPRIAPVLPHLKGQDVASDESGSDILGKQIEMECGNAIRYRTCSWQKVSAVARISLIQFPICPQLSLTVRHLVQVDEILAEANSCSIHLNSMSRMCRPLALRTIV